MSTTPYMSLTLPDPSSTVGPDWATDLNNAITLVDSHTHSTGSGVPVPTGGLNINADLSLNSFNLKTIRALIMNSQSGVLTLPADIGCLYQAAGDLYYNNGGGTAIQLTSGSGLNAASIGAIGGDYSTSTASLFYTSASTLFTFWSNTNVPAKIDVGPIVLRTIATPTNGITLNAPASLAAGYSLTLPGALPGSTMFVACASDGTISFTNSMVALSLSSTLAVSGAATFNGNVTLGDAAGDTLTITATPTAASANSMRAQATRTTGTTVSAGGIAISASFTDTSIAGTFVDVTGAAVRITPSAGLRPFRIAVVSDGSGTGSSVHITYVAGASVNNLEGYFKVVASSPLSLWVPYEVARFTYRLRLVTDASDVMEGDDSGIVVSPAMECLDLNVLHPTNERIYTLSFAGLNGSMRLTITACKLIAYEL
jgi:hypothetical protein